MARTAVIFRQTDVTRAVRGAKAAGLEVTRVEIGRDGKIVVSAGKLVETPEGELDRWRRNNGEG